MTAEISIRSYVVGFGDCILLRLPDGNETRNVLIDFGRAPNDAGSLEKFPAIAKDIAKTCKDRIDLLVMTHEHLDHMEGFYRQRDVFDVLDVQRVWMSLPSHPDYYSTYKNAKPQKKMRDSLRRFSEQARRKGLVLHPAFRSLIDNNVANKDRIEYLRKLGKKPVTYLARGKKGAAAEKWSKNIKIRVLAPEEDVSVYYTAKSGANGMALPAFAGNRDDEVDWTFPSVPRAKGMRHMGLSVSDYERLRRAIREDGVSTARFIDHAQNNTSLCLLIEVAGKRLLLPGDAELESWGMMQKYCKKDFKPVDFLKVAHHGSHNGTPLDALDLLLPVSRKDKAQVLVSTKRNVYGTENPVPDESLLTELRKRCHKLATTDGETGTYVDLKL